MPKKEWSLEERAAHAERMKKARAARRTQPAEQESVESVSAAPEELPPLMPPVEDESATPVVVEVEPPDVALPSGATPFDLYLASLSAETRELLNIEELRGAFEAAEKQAAEERRTRLRKAAAEKAMTHARASAGLLPAEKLEAMKVSEYMNQKVRFVVQMPFIPDTGGRVDDGLRIDGRLYQHGEEVTMTRGEWLSIRHQIWSMQQHELDFEGKGRLHHLRRDVAGRDYYAGSLI